MSGWLGITRNLFPQPERPPEVQAAFDRIKLAARAFSSELDCMLCDECNHVLGISETQGHADGCETGRVLREWDKKREAGKG